VDPSARHSIGTGALIFEREIHSKPIAQWILQVKCTDAVCDGLGSLECAAGRM